VKISTFLKIIQFHVELAQVVPGEGVGQLLPCEETHDKNICKQQKH
jgi:hypothetical protein